MKVCYFGTYDEFNPRNRLLIYGLRMAGVEVIECHTDLWTGTAHKVGSATGGLWRTMVSIAEILWKYLRLGLRYLRIEPHDVVVVGYAGQVDVFLAKLLTALLGRPLVFDAYQSIYDTLVVDRKLVSKRSFKARFARFIDRWSCRLADSVLLDTQAHINHFCTEFHLPREKFRRIFVGADERFYNPNRSAGCDEVFRVIYFGGYVPLHGTEHIVLAAHSLAASEGISFELVGNGQAYDQTRALADELGLTNISFVKTGMPGQWLSPQELAERIGQADVCLGVFGRGEKVDRVIPSKVYVALAMMKPVITSDSPAVREILTHRESAFLVDKGESQSLALAIDQLSKDRELREKIAAGGYDVFSRRASTAAVAQDLVRVLEEAVAARQKDGTQA